MSDMLIIPAIMLTLFAGFISIPIIVVIKDNLKYKGVKTTLD